MIHYKIFENIDKDLIENLINLKKKSSLYVFQSPEWIEAVINNSNNFDKLKIVFIYNNDDTILAAPFCVKNVYGCKELCWISSDIIDFNNVIISEAFKNDNNFKSVWKQIIKDISDKCDLIFLDKNPEFILSNKNPLINFEYKYYQKSFQLNLNKFDYKIFYDNKNNNKSKQTDRRKEKKLKSGDDLVNSYDKIDSSNFQLVEELIFEKISSYQSKKEKTFEYQKIINQYKKLVSYSHSDYKFNISILKKNDKKISSIFGVIFNGIYYYLIPVTHSSEFKNLSPGRFHIMNLINWSIENNIQIIDFTAGDEPYKYSWSNNYFKMFYYIKPLSAKGAIRSILLNLYYKLRKNYFLKKIYHYIQYEI